MSDYSKVIYLRLSPDLRERIKAAAQNDQRTISNWCRVKLEQATKETSK